MSLARESILLKFAWYFDRGQVMYKLDRMALHVGQLAFMYEEFDMLKLMTLL